MCYDISYVLLIPLDSSFLIKSELSTESKAFSKSISRIKVFSLFFMGTLRLRSVYALVLAFSIKLQRSTILLFIEEYFLKPLWHLLSALSGLLSSDSSLLRTVISKSLVIAGMIAIGLMLPV